MCTIYTDHYSCGHVVRETRRDSNGCPNLGTCLPTYRDGRTYTYHCGAQACDTPRPLNRITNAVMLPKLEGFLEVL
jgi:hypothetical protein